MCKTITVEVVEQRISPQILRLSSPGCFDSMTIIAVIDLAKYEVTFMCVASMKPSVHSHVCIVLGPDLQRKF